MTSCFENFSDDQKRLLEPFVSNSDKNIFVLKNLPEVIKGALFSRYSRSTLGLRSLLLKEFIQGEEASFDQIVQNIPSSFSQSAAIKKAQNFYDRILDGYGDDSIGELGGAHLAVENVSMLAAKAIEDCRIGGSPLEKSTRYVYFDQKVNGSYLYYKEPIIMTSAFRDLYLATCDMLFSTYSDLVPKLTSIMEQQIPPHPDVSKVAYAAALRAKVLDCLRGLLPASTLTNMGVFGNGRFFEALLQKLEMSPLSEFQEIGKTAFSELSLSIPSFIRRADPSHKHFQLHLSFKEKMQAELAHLASPFKHTSHNRHECVRVVHSDPLAVKKVLAALLFPYTSSSLHELIEAVDTLPKEEQHRILDAASSSRENRRHKSPRALEEALYTFEITADFGAYRDLQRHRTLSQERQLLTCDYGYYVPSEILNTPLEKPYRDAMDRAKEAYDRIAEDLPEEAQYICPMGYRVRWYFTCNLRTIQWLTELRSAPQGHPTYRYIAQEMARKVIEIHPEFEKFLRFVDFDGHELGRLSQEIRKEEKAKGRLS